MAVKATVLAARSVLEGLLLLRDPRRRRGVSGALPSSASGRPYRRWEAEAGSTSNSVIAIPSNNVIVLTCQPDSRLEEDVAGRDGIAVRAQQGRVQRRRRSGRSSIGAVI
jgi:hypothetical protein